VFEYRDGAYIFKTPPKRVVYYADVKEAFAFDGLLLMKGVIYEKSNPKNASGPFYAWAEPWNFEGKDTWALIAIHRGEHDGSPLGGVDSRNGNLYAISDKTRQADVRAGQGQPPALPGEKR
jgi:hypothetical protein